MAFAAFKAVGPRQPRAVGSIPIRLRQNNVCFHQYPFVIVLVIVIVIERNQCITSVSPIIE